MINKKNIILLLLTINFSCNMSQKSDNSTINALIETNKGEIITELFFKQTPVTVANFISLSEGDNKEVSEQYKGKNYYDGLTFHRVIEDFMIQGGDPTGTGSGSPGYSFKDEIVEILKHDSAGILSMANAGPGTNGSQFFITHKETPWLDGLHTVFGKVISGQEIVDSIEQGDSILSITIKRDGKEANKFNASKIFTNHFKEEEKLKKEKEKMFQKLKNDVSKEHNNLKTKSLETETGLKYFINSTNNGALVDENKTILTHYAVYFEDGTLLDTSILEVAQRFNQVNAQRKSAGGYTPIEARVGPKDMMISGFKEGLKLLKIGDKATLFLPYYLAYGETEQRGIPAKSNLIFEVEIVEQK